MSTSTPSRRKAPAGVKACCANCKHGRLVSSGIKHHPILSECQLVWANTKTFDHYREPAYNWVCKEHYDYTDARKEIYPLTKKSA